MIRRFLSFARWFPRAIVAVAGSISLLGCGEDQPSTPAPMVTPPAVTQPGPTVDAGGPALPVRRVVEQRSPFGHVEATDNLAVDGDFEFTGRSGQQAWLAFSDEQSTLNYATGGLCRSGIRCAILAPSESIVGFLVSPQAGDMTVSAWVKPLSGKCSDALVSVIDIDNRGPTVSITSKGGADASGWCRFEGNAPNYADAAPAILVEAAKNAKQSLYVDDVIVIPERTNFGTRSLNLPSASTLQRAWFVADWIRTHRQYGRPTNKRVE